MRLEELPLDQQEQTLYCYACGTVHTEEELGVCIMCNARICGLDGCTSLCACDDELRELGFEPFEDFSEAAAKISSKG
jgi:hypothetical protein